MPNIKNTLIILALFVLAVSCTNKIDQLENDPTITSVFSNEEAKELQKTLDFFTNQICISENIDRSNSNDCFYKFMDRMHHDVPENGTTELEIDYDKQKELYSYSVSNKIWIEFSGDYSYSDSINFYGIDISGKYSEYLQKLGEEIPDIAEYHNQTLRSGIVDPSFILKMSPESLDPEDIRIQLVVAIHFLTLNEKFEKFPSI